MYLSVIIPARNEQKHIKTTSEDIYRYLSSHSIDYEIIVVTNASTDKTADIVRGLSSSIPTIKLIDLKEGGKGLAVREGMLKASGDYRLFTDADNSTAINHIERMMPYFDKGYDVVIGSIAIKGHTVAQGSEPIWRRIFGNAGNLYIQLMAVPGIFDTQRGFKILSAKAANNIFPKMTMIGWAFDVELLALARKFGYKIKEVPVDWRNDPNTASHPRLSNYFKFFADTTRIRLNLLTGKYNH